MRDVDIFNTSAKPSTFLAYHKFFNRIRLLHTLLLYPGLNLHVEEAAKGQLTPKTAVEAAQTALKLLGNASMQVNRESRRCAIESLNPSLMDLADEDDLFTLDQT